MSWDILIFAEVDPKYLLLDQPPRSLKRPTMETVWFLQGLGLLLGLSMHFLVHHRGFGVQHRISIGGLDALDPLEAVYEHLLRWS